MLFYQQDHNAHGVCNIYAADSHCSGCKGYNDSNASLQKFDALLAVKIHCYRKVIQHASDGMHQRHAQGRLCVRPSSSEQFWQ